MKLILICLIVLCMGGLRDGLKNLKNEIKNETKHITVKPIKTVKKTEHEVSEAVKNVEESVKTTV